MYMYIVYITKMMIVVRYIVYTCKYDRHLASTCTCIYVHVSGTTSAAT